MNYNFKTSSIKDLSREFPALKGEQMFEIENKIRGKKKNLCFFFENQFERFWLILSLPITERGDSLWLWGIL